MPQVLGLTESSRLARALHAVHLLGHMLGSVSIRTRAALAGLFLAFAITSGLRAQESDPADREARTRELREIFLLYGAGQYEVVIRKVDEFIGKRGRSAENAPPLFLQAESQYHLGRVDDAIRTYESGLSLVEQLDNVEQRRFSPAFFRLGVLLRERGRLESAVASVETALRLEPQRIFFQIFLGELFSQQRQLDRARRHFRELAASSIPSSEERAVISLKLARLSSDRSDGPVTPPDLQAAPFYPGLSIGLLAVNELPDKVVLSDLCIVLESKWLFRCEVLAPVSISETDILATDRNQYDADRILEVLAARLPASARRHPYILAVVGRDIFARRTNYVFSWQIRNEDAGIGVLSAYRFITDVPDFYEPLAVGMRRVAIQALSTTGSMMKFSRPTHPECALAYPESLSEFQQKRSRLCEETIRQRDALLRRRGGVPIPFGEARNADVSRVYRAYALE